MSELSSVWIIKGSERSLMVNYGDDITYGVRDSEKGAATAIRELVTELAPGKEIRVVSNNTVVRVDEPVADVVLMPEKGTFAIGREIYIYTEQWKVNAPITGDDAQ